MYFMTAVSQKEGGRMKDGEKMYIRHGYMNLIIQSYFKRIVIIINATSHIYTFLNPQLATPLFD